MQTYEIYWINVTNGLSGVIPEVYQDEKTAKDDAKLYDRLYPGIMHKARQAVKNG